MNNGLITGCIIVKNEEDTLERCINSFKDIIDELIIVDTGSEDKTIDIAKKYTNNVYFFDWDDSFSNARNFAISKATNDWIVFLDADEYFSERSCKNLVRTIIDEGNIADGFLISGYNILESTSKIVDKFSVVRIFKNSKDIKYLGRIHEYIHKVGNLKLVDCTDIIEIYHTGYNKKVVEKQNKNERNITLLLKDIEEHPNGNTYFYLSQQYIGMNQPNKVYHYARKSLEYGITIMGREPNAYINLIQSSLKLKNESISYLISKCDECIRKYPDFPDIHLLKAECLLHNGDYNQAIYLLEDFLENKKWLDTSSYVINLNEAVLIRIYLLLGELYNKKINDPTKATYYYTKCIQIDKYHDLAFKGLFNLLINYENKPSITSFISSLYNTKSIEDLFFLAKQFAEMGNDDLKIEYRNMLMQFY